MFSILGRRVAPYASAPKCLTRSFVSFDLDTAQLELKKTCRDFANAKLKPIAKDLDREERFPAQQIDELGQLGLMGIGVSPENGGSGLDMLSTCIAIEELSRGCASTGIIMSIHNCLYANLLNSRGSSWQKERFLKPYTTGRIGAFALSEHDAGSDAASLKTTAKRDGDDYILNGTKAWVTSGVEAEAGVVFATLDISLKHKGITAFIVPFDSPGISRGRREEKMGIRASSTCDIVLDNVKVSRRNVIGELGEGFTIAMSQLQLARIGVAAQALGIAQASLDLAVDYAHKRFVFGKHLKDMQLVKSKIAKMATELEAARLLTWKAAVLNQQRRDFREASSMAKLTASRCATANAHRCVQVLGGMGYVREMDAERLYRDARITQIYGGVSEVQQLIIAERVSEAYTNGQMD